MSNEIKTRPGTRSPKWYDYAALPTILLVCILIPIVGILFESTRPVSPCTLVDDPKTTHVRIYQDGELMGIQSWGTPMINITISSKSNLEMWYFSKYVFGYSNWDSFVKTSILSLKYTTNADYKDRDNWEFITDGNDDPVHPVKANDGESMGFFFDLSMYVNSGYIENWENGTSIYLVMVKNGNYRITNLDSPIQILYLPL